MEDKIKNLEKQCSEQLQCINKLKSGIKSLEELNENNSTNDAKKNGCPMKGCNGSGNTRNIGSQQTYKTHTRFIFKKLNTIFSINKLLF